MVFHGLLQSSTFGQIANTLSKGKVLAWNDQKPDYVVPDRYLTPGQSTSSSADKTAVNTPNGSSTPTDDVAPPLSYMDIKSLYRVIPHEAEINLSQDPAGRPRRPSIRRPVSETNLKRRPSMCGQLITQSAICDSLCGYESADPRKGNVLGRAKTTAVIGSTEKANIGHSLTTSSTKVDLDSDTPTVVGENESKIDLEKKGAAESEEEQEESELEAIIRKNKYIIVTWDGDNDPENPRNWAFRRRAWCSALIVLLTYSVYLGSAIYTPAIPGLQSELGASATQGVLGLTLFVMGYGIGAMFLVPLQEIPRIGRNPVYISALFIFVIFQFPIIFSFHMPTILAFRFLTGFAGSPALATGGASMGDIWPPHLLAYALGIWSVGAVLGPLSGPVIGSFAAQYETWRWPIFELIWVSGFGFLVLFFFLPETYEGNKKLRSISEIEQAQTPITELLIASLWRPFRLCLEPAVMFANVYLGLTYAIFYLWFEAFPIVFNEMHGFSLSIGTLPYLAFFITGAMTLSFYFYYNARILPSMAKKRKGLQPEDFLLLGIGAAPTIPISLFIFGWTSAPDIHWIGPTIGAALYFPGIFLLFQTILLYLSISYPRYQGSILAGNDCVRSVIASVFPLFGHAFFTKLGVGGGCSLLAGLEIIMICIFFLLIKYGARLRAHSKFAETHIQT